MKDDNLIYFSKHISESQIGVDSVAAKKYFVEQVLPYVGDVALQRLLKAEMSGDAQAIRLEMARLFIEAEIMRPNENSSGSISKFFSLYD